ncbi:hypothetical protein SAMN05444166_0196 [Singulisphaera sp. GP187]|uniref:hypothetical protein n=1 Tax=Singulisphaera sp. GP187 TaxID=1882752 RepID=UPI00092CA1DE|nr:hypothetical protein [Singulisphaera sp. GP187]SIN69676.1 hypothetical protein SAMN05444166_0196 [Singulisphaera sp. GP187]
MKTGGCGPPKAWRAVASPPPASFQSSPPSSGGSSPPGSRLTYDAEGWLTDKLLILMNYGAEATPAVPVLIETLGNHNRQIIGKAAQVLARIGPAASAAVPALRAASLKFDLADTLTARARNQDSTRT